LRNLKESAMNDKSCLGFSYRGVISNVAT